MCPVGQGAYSSSAGKFDLSWLWRVWIVLVAAALATVVGSSWDSHTRRVQIDAPMVASGDHGEPMFGVLWRAGEQEMIERRVAQEQADEQKRRELAQVAATRDGAGQRVVATGDCSAIPEWFPAEIAWRESRCTRGIDTGNGYFGYAQIAGFHWVNLCRDLDRTVESEYDECVARLWNGGAGARHWNAG